MRAARGRSLSPVQNIYHQDNMGRADDRTVWLTYRLIASTATRPITLYPMQYRPLRHNPSKRRHTGPYRPILACGAPQPPTRHERPILRPLSRAVFCAVIRAVTRLPSGRWADEAQRQHPENHIDDRGNRDTTRGISRPLASSAARHGRTQRKDRPVPSGPSR